MNKRKAADEQQQQPAVEKKAKTDEDEVKRLRQQLEEKTRECDDYERVARILRGALSNVHVDDDADIKWKGMCPDCWRSKPKDCHCQTCESCKESFTDPEDGVEVDEVGIWVCHACEEKDRHVRARETDEAADEADESNREKQVQEADEADEGHGRDTRVE